MSFYKEHESMINSILFFNLTHTYYSFELMSSWKEKTYVFSEDILQIIVYLPII